MKHLISSYDRVVPLKAPVTVVVGSHTRKLSGKETTTLPVGEFVNIDIADDGTQWIVWGLDLEHSPLGYRQFNHRGKAISKICT